MQIGDTRPDYSYTYPDYTRTVTRLYAACPCVLYRRFAGGAANLTRLGVLDFFPHQHKSAVTIVGERMLGGGAEIASLTLAGIAADVKSENDTYITIEAALSDNKVTGDVVITVDTGAVVTLTDGWDYLTPGAITDVAPAAGQEGTVIIITGTNFFYNELETRS